MLTNTQKGLAGEQIFGALVMLSSAGDLELFKPIVDDDHTDIAIGRRGMVPEVAIQVKTAFTLNHKNLAVAKMTFPEGKPREHPRFVYAILFVQDLNVEAAWIVRCADFNRLASRGPGTRGKGLELIFWGSPTRDDKWAGYRCDRFELGPKLMSVIDSLPKGPPPRVAGAQFLLRRAEPRP
jgi:hypothetical protein